MEDSYLRDHRSFKAYRRDFEFTQHEADWVAKRRNVIATVVRNDVESLKQELDSPRYYKITDKNGLNLLQIAILQDSRAAFDYMISLKDFPLELVSKYYETALITAILVIDFDVNGNMEKDSDYYALKLVEKGANIFYSDHFGYTTLSCAALKHHVGMARMFIERGVDPSLQDIDGNTALHAALEHKGADLVEMVSLLVYYGCDPHIANIYGLIPFEKAVLYCKDGFVQEMLFYYTFDGCEKIETRLKVLLQLGSDRSELFHQFEGVILEDLSDTGYIQIFHLDLDFLGIFIEKFGSELMEILPDCTLHEWSKRTVCFEKIELLLNSKLRSEMIECILNLEQDRYLFGYLISHLGFDETSITEIACYLLSYGLNITEDDAESVFQKFGYCDLFKIILHMDIKFGAQDTRQIMPFLLYNPTLDLDECVENFTNYSMENIKLLLDFFSNSKLNSLCIEVYGDSVFDKIDSLPKVPFLVELARNVFRKYFIERFQIRTSKEFYTLIRKLQINNLYKKIITYEKKIYF